MKTIRESREFTRIDFAEIGEDSRIIFRGEVMGLQQQIEQDLVRAMKAKEALKLGTLRMTKTALKNRQIDLQHPLDDAEVIQVLKTLIKQRQDSVEQYTQAGRKDLADAERMEIAIIEEYLPPMLSEPEMERVVDETIQELGATDIKDIGPVMKAVMSKLATAMVDGRMVNQMVRSKLAPGRNS